MTSHDLYSKLLSIAQSDSTDKETQIHNLIELHDAEILNDPINLIISAQKIFMHGYTKTKYDGWKEEVKQYFARFGGT